MPVSAAQPGVLVRLADPAQRAIAVAALEARFAVTVEDPAEHPAADIAAWGEAGFRCAVLDYQGEDAASVKLAQKATDAADAPRLVFVMPEGGMLDRSQFLMALNEGAYALVPAPLDRMALATYVERAALGPARLRREAADPSDAALAQAEEQVRHLRARNAALEKLVAYLLATPASAQTRRLLVVGDSAFQREHIERLFTEYGFDVRMAADAGEALRLALAEKPRIVVSDLDLADGDDGVALCHAMKIDHKIVPCHFVVCTANRDRIPSVLVPGNGVDDCVAKPSNAAEQRDFVARVAMGLLL